MEFSNASFDSTVHQYDRNCAQFGKHIHRPTRLAFGSMFMLMAVFGSISNTLSLMCVRKFPKRNSNSNKLLLSLIIADTIVCFVVLPFQGTRMLSEDALYNCMVGHFQFSITSFALFSSTLPICIIGYDRYVLIANFQNYHRLVTNRFLIICMVATILLSIISPLLFFFIADLASVLFLINHLVPLFTLPVFYIKIIHTVKEKQRDLQKHMDIQLQNTRTEKDKTRTTATTNSVDDSRKKKKLICKRSRKIAKRCTLLILTYFSCSLAALIFFACIFLNTRIQIMDMSTYDVMGSLAFLGMTLNSCLNPIIYVMRDSQFQKALKKMFGKAN